MTRLELTYTYLGPGERSREYRCLTCEQLFDDIQLHAKAIHDGEWVACLCARCLGSGPNGIASIRNLPELGRVMGMQARAATDLDAKQQKTLIIGVVEDLIAVNVAVDGERIRERTRDYPESVVAKQLRQIDNLWPTE